MNGSALRIVVVGNHEWTVPSIRAVAASNHRIVGVLTRGPRPARRGSRLRPTPVAEAAVELELPLTQVETVSSGPGFDAIAQATPDVLVVVAHGELLERPLLEVPRLAPVNVHFSLLPELRGASPVRHAILEGILETGVTTMIMDEGLDTGPILLQRTVPVGADEDSGSLGARLAATGGELLVETIDALASGTARPLAQDHGRATWAPPVRSADRVLAWEGEASSLVRRVRAMAPTPGAATSFRGRRLKILRASVAGADALAPPSPGSPTVEPGTIVRASARQGLIVAAGSGAVELVEVAPEGRGRMTGSDFVGGSRPEPGERLGG